MSIRPFVYGLGALATLAVAGLLAHGPIVRSVVSAKLERVAERLDMPMAAERIEPRGWTAVRLHRLRIGPTARPNITIATVTAAVDPTALWGGDVQITQVDVDGPILHLHSGGTVSGLERGLRELIPPSRVEATAGDGDGSRTRVLPRLLVSNAQVIDHDGLLEVGDAQLDFSEGQLSGAGSMLQPAMGRCTLEGSMTAMAFNCDTPFSRSLPLGLRLEVGQIQLTREPRPRIRLPAVRLGTEAGSQSMIGAFVGGLSAEIGMTLARGADGRWPLEVKLKLPGGGEFAGSGGLNRDGLDVSAEVKDVQFGHTQESVGGALTGRYRLSIRRKERTAMLEGDGRLTNLVVQDPALAKGPIGPINLSMGGRLDVHAIDLASRAFEVRVSAARIGLGEVEAEIDAFVDTRPDVGRIRANVSTGRVEAPALVAALPKGLLPMLEPIEAVGRLSFTASLDIDQTDLKKTKLSAGLDLKRLKSVQLNERIDLEALRDVFTTRFEMPGEKEDEVITLVRETGPNSSRWTSLDQITPLLPLAVVTQEDGGFYRHGGVSMYHLRGSLVRNLERKRFARGGSTLTMQLARNLFLHRKKTLARKLQEIILAWALEQTFEKDELITLYLNVVEFGPEIFGIKDAAAHYFATTPAQLTPIQVAWIVRLLPAPRKYYPQFEKRKLTRSHTRSLNRLIKLLVDRGHLDASLAGPIGPEDLWAGMEDLPLGRTFEELSASPVPLEDVPALMGPPTPSPLPDPVAPPPDP